MEKQETLHFYGLRKSRDGRYYQDNISLCGIKSEDVLHGIMIVHNEKDVTCKRCLKSLSKSR